MNIAELVAIAANSRARTNLVLPLPDAPDCTDYAITECGEYLKQYYVDMGIIHATQYLDAMLRQRRTEDKRNNAKSIDARLEWAQVGYMIASGLAQTDYELQGYASDGGTFHDVLGYLVQEAQLMDGSLVDAMIEWVIFCQFENWDPAELLRETCANFEKKHIKRD